MKDSYLEAIIPPPAFERAKNAGVAQADLLLSDANAPMKPKLQQSKDRKKQHERAAQIAVDSGLNELELYETGLAKQKARFEEQLNARNQAIRAAK